MSEEKIKLRVPTEVPEGFPEYVSQGNLETDLPLGEVIEVESQKFADSLVRDYGLVEISPVEHPLETEYPADFPRREVFIGQDLALIDLRAMDRDQLTAFDGVGAKTADAVIEYFASENPTGENNNGGN